MDKREISWRKMCAAALIMFGFAVYAASPPDAGINGEIEYVRATREGDVRNVFQLGMFGGVVVLPRTLTLRLVKTARVAFTTGENSDSTIKGGQIFLGEIAEKNGVRHDAAVGTELPFGSQAVERVGPLTLEHYAAGKFNLHSSTVLTDGREYLWFTGSAELLAREVAIAFASENGPNREFLEARNAPSSACFSNILVAHLAVDQDGRSLMLWPASQAAEAAFDALGFKVGDKFEFDDYVRPDERGYETFERILKTGTPTGTRIPIKRRGKQIVVSVSGEALTRYLPKCAAAGKP